MNVDRSITIVCFGDSNTHGADPDSEQRLARQVRWPGVLRRELGDGVEVIEEGLSGRTTAFEDPFEVGRKGSAYLVPCLLSHEPLDLVVIMLGTNDLKQMFQVSPVEIAAGAGMLVRLARGSFAGPGGGPPAVLLVAPVPLGDLSKEAAGWGFADRAAASRQLAPLYRQRADETGATFLDAGESVTIEGGDGVHLDAAAHERLGVAVAKRIRDMLNPAG